MSLQRKGQRRDDGGVRDKVGHRWTRSCPLFGFEEVVEGGLIERLSSGKRGGRVLPYKE